MIGKMDIDRFKTIFSRILNKRIVPFVEEHVLEILDNRNFTGYYKNETIGDQTFIRPIFGLEIFDLPILGLIVYELNNPEFKKELHIDILPVNERFFFLWLRLYLQEKKLLFHIMYKDPKTNEETELTFYGMLELNYSDITRRGYEYLL